MSPRGGFRSGAGRKKGEPTKAIRVPIAYLSEIESLLTKQSRLIPLFSNSVEAGFPSPADDYIERHLDLNQEFIKHPSATFMLRASGNSMVNAGIFSGDMLLVDRSITPTDGKIVIAAIDGELTVKRLSSKGGKVQLLAENPLFPPIDITHEQDMVIWGVVTLVLHKPL